MSVLTAVCVSITNYVMFDSVLIGTEGRRIVFIAVVDDVLVYVLDILTNEELNPVRRSDGRVPRLVICPIRRFLVLFLSLHSRGLTCLVPFSPATT